nr:MAG TPA: hypothetical protein [Caudoviricetes sp.]
MFYSGGGSRIRTHGTCHLGGTLRYVAGMFCHLIW